MSEKLCLTHDDEEVILPLHLNYYMFLFGDILLRPFEFVNVWG